MRVMLQRNLFAGGNRYRVQSAGTELPDDVELPIGAKVWDGKEFVAAPEGKKDREALAKKSSKAVEDAEKKEKEDAEKAAKERPLSAIPLAVYDPRYRSPNSPDPIQGAMPLTGEDRKAEEEREKKERWKEQARREKAEKEGLAAASKEVEAEKSEKPTPKPVGK